MSFEDGAIKMDVRSIGAAIAFLICLLGVVAAVGCWFGVLISMFKAAANRKQGVPYIEALNWFKTTLFRRNLYLEDLFNPDGVRWAKRTIYCFIGFPTAVIITATVIELTRRFLPS